MVKRDEKRGESKVVGSGEGERAADAEVRMTPSKRVSSLP